MDGSVAMYPGSHWQICFPGTLVQLERGPQTVELKHSSISNQGAISGRKKHILTNKTQLQPKSVQKCKRITMLNVTGNITAVLISQGYCPPGGWSWCWSVFYRPWHCGAAVGTSRYPTWQLHSKLAGIFLQSPSPQGYSRHSSMSAKRIKDRHF